MASGTIVIIVLVGSFTEAVKLMGVPPALSYASVIRPELTLTSVRVVLPATFRTSSLKVIVILVVSATLVAEFAGTVEITVGSCAKALAMGAARRNNKTLKVCK